MAKDAQLRALELEEQANTTPCLLYLLIHSSYDVVMTLSPYLLILLIPQVAAAQQDAQAMQDQLESEVVVTRNRALTAEAQHSHRFPTVFFFNK